jgi:hypothetical protein
MKDLLVENFENFWKNVVLRKILRTFVFGKHIVDLPPPLHRRQYFPGKIFALAVKKFFMGPWNGRGPKFWTTPPQSETGWHGPECYRSRVGKK